MTARRTKPDTAPAAVPSEQTTVPIEPTRRAASAGHSERQAVAPRSREEAEARYVTARTAWVDAMHKASSGRSADLASLAIAQEAYEAAAIERTRWEHAPKAAVPVEPAPRRNIDIAIGQELAWRRVREADGRPRGLMGRLFGKRSRD
jgi:hypothetical protein